MGCFITCFGSKENKNKNKKRRRLGKKRPTQEQDHQNYIPLDSDVSLKLDIKENCASDSNLLKEKQEETAIQKIKKKVRFNLNVKAYEPIPHNYEDDDDEDLSMYLLEETKLEFKTEIKNRSSLHYEEEDIIASSCISNHRYKNCINSYDEEDDELMMLQDEIEDSDDDDDQSEDDQSEEDFPWEFKSSSGDVFPEASVDDQLVEVKSNVRDRSKYVHSVLNPIENLSQWKAVKAKGVNHPQYMMSPKENFLS